MFCSNCGSIIDDRSAFCSYCGAEINQGRGVANQTSNAGMAKWNPYQSGNVNLNERKDSTVPVVILLSTLALAAVLILVLVVTGSSLSLAKAKIHLQLAQHYLEELDYERAIAAYEMVIEIEPNNLEAYEGLIHAYVGKEDSDGILSTYEKAVANLDEEQMEIVRDDVLAGYLDLIDTTIEKGDQEAAWEIVTILETIDSDTADKATQLVLNHDAVVIIEPSIEEIEDEGADLINKSRYAEAISYYEKEIASDPGNTFLYCACAAAYLGLDDPIGALEVLEKGRASGADVDVIDAREEYIRKNTTITYQYTEKKEWLPGNNDPVSGYAVRYFNENGDPVTYESHDSKGSYYTKYEYDQNGKLSYERRDGDGSSYAEYEYDQNGNLTYFNNEYGDGYGYQRSWYTYNEHGDPVYEKHQSRYLNGDSGSETYYTYEYDSNGRKLSCVDNGGTTTSYEYDASGNMVHSVEVRDDSDYVYERVYRYDSYGRVVSYESIGTDESYYESYEYDERGNMIRKIDWISNTSYEYDLMDQNVSSTGTFNGDAFENTYTNTYHFHGDIYSLIN